MNKVDRERWINMKSKAYPRKKAIEKPIKLRDEDVQAFLLKYASLLTFSLNFETAISMTNEKYLE